MKSAQVGHVHRDFRKFGPCLGKTAEGIGADTLVSLAAICMRNTFSFTPSDYPYNGRRNCLVRSVVLFSAFLRSKL